jgi:hypothetical protein
VSAAALRSFVSALRDFEATRDPRAVSDMIFYIMLSYAGAVIAAGGAYWSHAIGGGLIATIVLVVAPCFYVWKRHREWARGLKLMNLCLSSVSNGEDFYQTLSVYKMPTSFYHVDFTPSVRGNRCVLCRAAALVHSPAGVFNMPQRPPVAQSGRVPG